MQQIRPFLMFEGRAREAIDFYLRAFPDGELRALEPWGEENPAAKQTVKSSLLRVGGLEVRLFDSPAGHAFGFTPAVSLFVECASAAEADRLFAVLSEGGETLMPLDDYPFAKRYGWTNDRFGVSWQIAFGETGA